MTRKLTRCQNTLTSLILISAIASFIIGGFIYYDTLNGHSKKVEVTTTTTIGPTNPWSSKTTAKVLTTTNVGLHLHPSLIVDQISEPEKFEAYSVISNRIKRSLDTKFNVCDEFYQYVNNRRGNSLNVFEELKQEVVGELIRALEHPVKLKVLEKAKIYYQKCVEAERNPQIIHQDGKVLQKIYKNIISSTPLQFPFLSNATLEKPSPKDLSEIIAILLREYDINAFLKLTIKTNWKNPTGLYGHKGYRVFLDQPDLKFTKDEYENGWEEKKKGYHEQVKRLFVEFAEVLNKTVDENEIELDAWSVIELERQIALETQTFDRTKKEMLFNAYTKSSAAEQFAFDFSTYFYELSKDLKTAVKENLQDDRLEFIITAPAYLQRLEALIFSRQTPSRTVYNYIVWKLLENLKVYFPKDTNDILAHVVEVSKAKCADKAAEDLSDLIARIYLDYKFIYPKRLEELKNDIGSVVEQVVNGFQMQIDKLSWMVESTKEKISKKLRFLVRNVLFNDNIGNDQYLIDKHADLKISNSIDYNQITTNIKAFNFQQNFDKLLLDSTKRDELVFSITSLAPFYDYGYNAITIPLGLIRRPIYDRDFPASTKFANLGFLIAKSLMSIVDEEGVQWDEIGKLENWMDKKSTDGITVMEECLANTTKISDETIIKMVVKDGGAIKTAYNAYKAHVTLHDQDKLFPDTQFSELTHDQIFFLSYANIHAESGNLAKGVLQNVPAFKSAFYCPVESKYAPKEHCHIWDSEVKAVAGVPPMPPEESSLQIGNKVVGESKEYQQVAELISQKMNIEYSPCDNFYEFACGNARDSDVDIKKNIEENVKEKVIKYLERNEPSEKRFAKIGKSFFQACSTQHFNATLIRTFIDKIDNKFGIKFPLLNNGSYQASALPEIGEFGHFLSSTYDIHPFFKIDVQPNLRKQFNTNPYLLTYSDFELTFRAEIYGQLEWPEIKQEFIETSAKFLQKVADIGGNLAKDSISKAVKLEENLAELLAASKHRHIRDSDYEVVSLHDFHQLFPFFKISGFIRGIYKNEGKNVTNILKYILNRQSKVAIYHKPRQIERHYAFYTAFNQGTDAFLDNILLRILWRYRFLLDAEEIEVSDKLRSALYLPPIAGEAKSSRKKSCLSLLNHFYPPIIGNLAVKALYPKNVDFKGRQREVATIAEYVLQSFQDIFNRLSWLSLSEKKVLISKIKQISRVYGAPNWALDDENIDVIYSDLTYNANDSIATRWLEVNAFIKVKMYQRLTQSGEIKRDDFLSSFRGQFTTEFKSTVDYDTNSFYLTLPFLEHDLVHDGHPAIWKFTMIGDEIGKTLGKLLDESGLERNEHGIFSKWMKAKTRKRVKEMVDELEKEYEVIIGRKGLNIHDEFAEDVGLKLSFRGFQAYTDYFGDDLALPNKTLSHLSSYQLYFLSHAQHYCQQNPADVFATPNNVKVLVSLRNSEEFRTAYHCKADSLYAPKNFAKIWNSPAKTSVGPPIYDKALPNLNVPKLKPKHSKKYLECAKYFEDSVDNSIDPCEDFYSYTCNHYNGRNTFADLDLKNTLKLVKSMIIDIKEDDNQAVKKAKTFYNKCREDYSKTYDNVNVARAVVAEVEQIFGHKFSLQSNHSVVSTVSPEELSYIIGYLSGKYGEDIIVSNIIYTNSRHPEKGYSVYLTAEEFEEESKGKIKEVLKELNDYLKYIRGDIDQIQEKVLEMATAFVKIEAQFFKAARRFEHLNTQNFSDVYLPITVKKFEEEYDNSFDVKSYLKGMVNLVPEVKEKVTDDDFELTIEDEKAFKNVTKELTAILQGHNEYLADYIFYRTIQMANQEFSLGGVRVMEEGQEVPKKRRKGWKRKLPKFPGQGIHYPKKDFDILSHPEAVALGLTGADLKCLVPTKELFNEALNYIFVKAIHPNDTERDDRRIEATKIVDSTLLGFRSMLDQLNWMDRKSKKEAYNKIGQLVKNVAFPNISVDESKLERYYDDLNISSTSDFREMNIKLFVFNQQKVMNDLKKTSFDRLDFGSAFDLNAWYQQASNSITFPLSILQAPFFDPEWPAAVNYGSIGVVAGHELTHGFDDQGIQWDGDGRLKNWISNSSFQSFRKMADCVVNEYNQFCYDENHCVNGQNTQGENIADNGGIQAAFRAFRNELSLKEEAQSLPGDFIGRFTSDQLFFLAFGRVWCSAPMSSYERDVVLRDVHSPSDFRVRGALQNFPAFRDAFNCPLKKKRSTEKHCQVWVTEVKPNLSTPPTTTTVQPINVPQRSLISANNSAYSEASQKILKSLDIQQDVCNDFYGYVCNNLHQHDLTLKEEATVNIAKHISRNLEDDSIQFPHKKLINIYYTRCIKERSEQNSKKRSFEKLLEGLEKVAGSKYPAFEEPKFDSSAISDDFLEKSMGFLQGHHDIGSIFDTRVEKNLETSDLTNPPYLLHVGLPKLIYNHDVYSNNSDETARNKVIDEYFELLVAYSNVIGKTPKNLQKLAKDVYYIERLVASIYKNDTLRQGPKYHQHLTTMGDLQNMLKGFKFNEYFKVMLEKSGEDVRKMFLRAEGLIETRIVSTFGIDHIKELFRKIYGNQVTNESLLNYFYFRLLWSHRALLLNLKSDGLPQNENKVDNSKLSCALQTRDIPILTSRVFLEKQHVVFEVVKDKVLITTSSLINALQGLLAESTWMSSAAKTRIINKLDSLQLNVIADHKVLDDEYLRSYFDGLSYQDDMTSSELKLAVYQFNVAKGYQILNVTSPSPVSEFEATTFEISYDYSKNTLNIPAAAVLAPFYNPEYPFTINFAALGVKIAQHLVQSFDLYGVQIDQSGRFVELDQETSLGYGRIGTCLNNQYGTDTTNEFSSIFGHNAAVHIAKQALQLTEAFTGHSPSFADNVLRQFTDDQVFYIKYSGQFCDHPNAKKEFTINTNKAKLLNILQNDAMFGSTFNCPTTSRYVKKNRCEFFNIAKTENQNAHIAPQPKTMSKVDRRYGKYENIVKHLNESLDTNVDPCNDFYNYTCGKLEPNRKSKEQISLQTQIEAIKAITSAEKSTSLRKLRHYFDQCVDFHKSFEDKIRDGTVIKNKVQDFIKQIGNNLRISMYSRSKIIFIPLQHKIISYLHLFEDLQTFITTTIEVDNRENQAKPGVNPMLLTVDEPTLLWPKEDYLEWGEGKAKKYKEEMLDVLVKFGKIWPNAVVDEVELGKYIDTFLFFEKLMTKPAYYTADREDSQPTIYPVMRMNKFNFFQWTSYTTQLATYTGLPRLSTARYAVKFENTLLMLSKNIGQIMKNDDKVNYFFMRLLMKYKHLIPGVESPRVNVEEECARQTQKLFKFANGKAYINYLSNHEDTTDLLPSLKRMFNNIRSEFRGTIDEIRWISEEDRKFMHQKLLDLNVNWLYPDLISTTNKLDQYYLKVNIGKDYFETTQNLNLDKFRHQMEYLTNANYLEEFENSPSTISGWNKPEYNSLTIPQGVVEINGFDKDFPVSVNYGRLGVQIARELSKVFEGPSLQWIHAVRNLTVVTKTFKDKIQEMEKCLIDQYRTEIDVSEVKADNTGIHVAYRAYSTHKQLNGPDLQLSNLPYSKYTHDQLFFLSFATSYCDYREDSYSRLSTSIKNFPAFRSAFNCPVDSLYTPKERCRVWSPDEN